MKPHDDDRRRSCRRRSHEEHGIVATRIRPGHSATVVDVSAGGALIETPRRLLPGSTVELQVDRAHDRIAIRGSVGRCSVSRLTPTCVWYRGAIVFERMLPWFPTEAGDGYSVLPHQNRGGTPFRASATQTPL